MNISFYGFGWFVRGKTLWMCLSQAVLWVIWLQRHSQLSKEKYSSREVVWDRIIFLASFGLGYQSFLWHSFGYYYERDRVAICTHVNKMVSFKPLWISPPNGSIKFNFDGCALGTPNQLSIGGKSYQNRIGLACRIGRLVNQARLVPFYYWIRFSFEPQTS